MELIKIEGVSMTSLFAVQRAPNPPPATFVMDSIADRYSFREKPSAEDVLNDKGTFGSGVYAGGDIDSFEIYSDGVIVRARRDSRYLDDFLSDVEQWLEKETGAKRIETARVAKMHESVLLVRTEARLLDVLSPIQAVQSMLAERLRALTSFDAAPFEPFGFSLAVDETKITGMRPTFFRIERRQGMPFHVNFYISRAPLPSADHLDLLEQLEKIVS